MKYLLTALALTLCPPAAGADAAPPGTGEYIVSTTCRRCHDAKHICRALTEKDKRQWAATLDRMINKRGAPLSPQDHTRAYNWLILQNPEDVPLLCPQPKGKK